MIKRNWLNELGERRHAALERLSAGDVDGALEVLSVSFDHVEISEAALNKSPSEFVDCIKSLASTDDFSDAMVFVGSEAVRLRESQLDLLRAFAALDSGDVDDAIESIASLLGRVLHSEALRLDALESVGKAAVALAGTDSFTSARLKVCIAKRFASLNQMEQAYRWICDIRTADAGPLPVERLKAEYKGRLP